MVGQGGGRSWAAPGFPGPGMPPIQAPSRTRSGASLPAVLDQRRLFGRRQVAADLRQAGRITTAAVIRARGTGRRCRLLRPFTARIGRALGSSAAIIGTLAGAGAIIGWGCARGSAPGLVAIASARFTRGTSGTAAGLIGATIIGQGAGRTGTSSIGFQASATAGAATAGGPAAPVAAGARPLERPAAAGTVIGPSVAAALARVSRLPPCRSPADAALTMIQRPPAPAIGGMIGTIAPSTAASARAIVRPAAGLGSGQRRPMHVSISVRRSGNSLVGHNPWRRSLLPPPVRRIFLLCWKK